MNLSAQLKRNQQLVPARLYAAYSGVRRFTEAGWARLCGNYWVIDYLNCGQQIQRIQTGRKFTRFSGIAALYAPGTCYHEYHGDSSTLDSSAIVFGLQGELADSFRALTGRAGYCHFQDMEQLLGQRLHKLAELLFYARPGAQLLACSIFLELLGLTLTAKPAGAHLRKVCSSDGAPGEDDLPGRTERYIRAHISETIRVGELARSVGCSPSSFAHAYTILAGESPYRTVLRLKIQAAKQFLLQDGLSVKETADRLGFPSEFQLSRTFKQLEGVAPKHYVLALTQKMRAGRQY